MYGESNSFEVIGYYCKYNDYYVLFCENLVIFEVFYEIMVKLLVFFGCYCLNNCYVINYVG